MSQSIGTIFVVDDDDMVLNLHLRLLEPQGYAVRTFSLAHECLAAASAQPPACIVSDLQMPGMDGVQLIRELRRIGCEVPVIVVTAALPPLIQLDQARRAGACRILAKPASRADLLQAIEDALEGSERLEGSLGAREGRHAE